MVVKKSEVKEYAKSNNVNVSSDYYEELATKVKVLIDESVKRAKANDRKTVMAKDI